MKLYGQCFPGILLRHLLVVFISTWVLAQANKAIAQDQDNDRFPGLLEIPNFLPATPQRGVPRDVFSVRLASIVVTDRTAYEALRQLCAQVSHKMAMASSTKKELVRLSIKRALELPWDPDKEKFSLELHNVTVAEVLEHFREATKTRYIWKWSDAVVHVKIRKKTGLDQTVRRFKVENKRAIEILGSLCDMSDPAIICSFSGALPRAIDLGEPISFEKQDTNLRECLLEVLRLSKGCGHWVFRERNGRGVLSIHCGR